MQTLSEQLRRQRVSRGLSLADVARRAGTSVATLSRYENGWSRFEIHTLRKLASALDCDLRIAFKPRPARPPRLKPKALVERLQRLFWDHVLKPDDLTIHTAWIVERVLEFGQLEDVQALREALGTETFLAAVAQARFRSPRTRSCWQHILKLEGRSCTRSFYRNTPWNS